MKITILSLLAALSFAIPPVTAHAEDTAKPTWTCNLRVGTAKQLNKTLKDPNEKSKKDKNQNKNWNTRESSSKISRQMVLPVTVTFMGKDPPASGLSLKTVFIGKRDEETAILGETTTEVTLDAKGSFKTELKSPEAVITKTMRSQGRRTVTTTSGDVLTGSIVRLVYEGKVLKSWASRADYAKLAKQDTLDTEALLKTR